MKKIYLLFALILFMSSCEKDEIITNPETNVLSEELKTVSKDQLSQFLKTEINNKSYTWLTILPEKISLEPIRNSKELMTIIPAKTTNPEVLSRIVLLNIRAKLLKVVIHTIEEESNWAAFSGRIIITNLNGDFLNGYRLKDGKFVTRFIKKNISGKWGDCVLYGAGNWDCGSLSEIILTGSSQENQYIDLDTGGGGWGDYDWGLAMEGDPAWDFTTGLGGESGGDTTTTPIPDEEETNDPEDCNTFDEKVKEVVNLEGGFVDDPIDTGGATNKGISWPIWVKSAYDICNVEPTLENLKNLTDEQAKAIYKKLFWDPMLCDDIQDGDMRFLLFDFNVNSGPNAVKVLQQTLNSFGNNLTVDGGMGPATRNALNNTQDQVSLYNKFKANRQKYYDDITAASINRFLKKFPNASASDVQKKTMKKYINGWTNRNNSFKDKTEENQTNVNC